MRLPILYVLLAVLIGIFHPSAVQAQAADGGVNVEELAKADADPITTMLNLPVQNNFQFGLGTYNRTSYLMKIQPVRLMRDVSRTYRIRSRVVIPVAYAPDLTQPSGGVFGLGDITLASYFTLRQVTKFNAGIGPAMLFPTATDTKLGTGKWAAGISGAGLVVSKRWLLAVIATNLWSFAGDSDRRDVNLLQLDYSFAYYLGNRWIFISKPSIVADWNSPNKERWLVPIGGGIGRIQMAGKNAFSLQVHAYYNAIHPDTFPYADWTLRLQFQFFFLKPRS